MMVARRELCAFAVAFLVLSGCQGGKLGRDPEMFGMYTMELDGDNHRLVLASATQEMTHARVSPDHKWIAFTRYNRKALGGRATEDGGYLETEIMRVRIDGTGLETVIPAKKGAINTNSSWTDGGKSLIWVCSDNARRIPQIMKIDLATRKITRLPTPAGIPTTDPHIRGNKIVFPVKGRTVDSIYVMNLDGRGYKQVTHPKLKKTDRTKFHVGDYDPKLSPDGNKVACMRFHGGENWRIVVTDITNGREKDLTGPGRTDAMPEWSDDGKLILFRHIDRKKPRNIGIWTMKPDGSDRKQVPAPRAQLHNHPIFFPGEKAGPNAKIIYVARKNPRIP